VHDIEADAPHEASLDEAQTMLKQRAMLHDEVRAYLKACGFRRGEVSSIVAQCAEELGIMPVPTFDSITSADLLLAIRAKAQAISERMEQAEAAEASTSDAEPPLL
jgi:hypothetical protein